MLDNSLPRLADVKVSVLRCVVRLAVQALLVDDISGPIAGVMRCMVSNDAAPCIWGPRAELDLHATHHILTATVVDVLPAVRPPRPDATCWRYKILPEPGATCHCTVHQEDSMMHVCMGQLLFARALPT